MQDLPSLVARTKLQRPRPRTALVARPQLERRIAQALTVQPLVLLAAAAGFGKTVALSRALDLLSDAPVAWISADVEDDLARLLQCLLAALEPLDLPFRVAPEALVAGVAEGRAGRRAAVDALVNALGAADAARGVIAIDDLHRIEDRGAFEFLDALVERLPAGWSLAVTARVDPPLALARLRARGELAEFRPEDLRFSDDEIGALLAAAGRDGEPVALLRERTQGWAAGLKLALSAAAGPSARGAVPSLTALDRPLFDYLAAEVFAELPAELQQFLARCAVLVEWTPARCAAVAQRADAAALLDDVARRGLFVYALDDGTLRPHDLFREFLLHRLQRDAPTELPALLARAAAGETDPVRRISYKLRARDWDGAAADLSASAPSMLTAARFEPVAALLAQFPPAWREKSAALAQVEGLFGWSRWDAALILSSLQRAAMLYEAGGDATATSRARVYLALAHGHCDQIEPMEAALAQAGDPHFDDRMTRLVYGVTRLQHAFERGRLHSMPALFAPLLDDVAGSDDAADWFVCMPPVSQIGLRGMAPLLRRYVDGALRVNGDEPSALHAAMLGFDGGLLIWSGRLDEGLAQVAASADEARWLGQPPARVANFRVLSAIAHALRGDGAAAAADIDAVLAAAAGLGGDAGARRAYLQTLAARCLLCAGGDAGRAEALQRLQDAAARRSAAPSFYEAATRALPALQAIAGGDAAAAGAAIDALLADDEPVDVFGLALQLRLQRAALKLAAGDTAGAADALRDALAQPAEGMSAALAGLPRLEALAGLRGALDEDRSQRIAQWVAQARALRQPAAADVAEAAAAGAGGLTARELEVLARIAAGDSNKLIARAFDLSPHTVKRHVANILDKLDLASRGQAAAWYQRSAAPR